MTEQEVKLIIGSLLHDIGKVVYRQGDDRRNHSQSGYEYLKKDERLNLNFYKDVYGDGLWYLEISHKNASKYYVIHKLRKLLHPSAITGMGDNLNDIPLFEACDRSCAVGNAHKEVKERADYILDTNLNAGVVKFLEKEMK